MREDWNRLQDDQRIVARAVIVAVALVVIAVVAIIMVDILASVDRGGALDYLQATLFIGATAVGVVLVLIALWRAQSLRLRTARLSGPKVIALRIGQVVASALAALSFSVIVGQAGGPGGWHDFVTDACDVASPP